MDLMIALAVIGALLYFALKPQQKKIKTDRLTFDYTDDLHEIKCSIAEAEYMLESIEQMRWNDKKNFEFSFIDNIQLEGKTRSFKAMMTGLQDKKHLNEIKKFVRVYKEHQEEKYHLTLMQLYRHHQKLNSSVQVSAVAEPVEPITAPKTVSAFDFSADEIKVEEFSGDEFLEAVGQKNG